MDDLGNIQLILAPNPQQHNVDPRLAHVNLAIGNDIGHCSHGYVKSLSDTDVATTGLCIKAAMFESVVSPFLDEETLNRFNANPKREYKDIVLYDALGVGSGIGLTKKELRGTAWRLLRKKYELKAGDRIIQWMFRHVGNPQEISMIIIPYRHFEGLHPGGANLENLEQLPPPAEEPNLENLEQLPPPAEEPNNVFDLNGPAPEGEENVGLDPAGNYMLDLNEPAFQPSDDAEVGLEVGAEHLHGSRIGPNFFVGDNSTQGGRLGNLGVGMHPNYPGQSRVEGGEGAPLKKTMTHADIAFGLHLSDAKSLDLIYSRLQGRSPRNLVTVYNQNMNPYRTMVMDRKDEGLIITGEWVKFCTENRFEEGSEVNILVFEEVGDELAFVISPA